ncbi:MAG: TIGR01777 family oxidoreductase [Planctomycetes bacterium]|nr:TIGR01777 family oxidoreductase [Planctomycetota bacterium]
MKVDKRVLVTGGTGFVGTRLRSALAARGHWVSIATRTPKAQRALQAGIEYVPWLPDLAKYDAVVHLAGAGLFERRWSAAYKSEIRASRVESTHTLVDALAASSKRPAVLISGSAVGIYGVRGAVELSESASCGDDFLANVCKDWEREAERATTLGMRTVLLRTGVVLGQGGGALAALLTPFKLGLGGPIGSGAHWMSWIHIDDLVGLIVAAIDDPRFVGPLNGVAPGACTNKTFSVSLGRALHRPALLPLPPFALRAMLGEVATVLTSSQRCVPARALSAGYGFKFADIDACLRDLSK